MKKLFKGSRNPPLDKYILLKSKDGYWGHGDCFRWVKNSMGEKADRKIYFNFHSPQQTLLGEPKSSFVAWMDFPIE
jgi:hypothetical protein